MRLAIQADCRTSCPEKSEFSAALSVFEEFISMLVLVLRKRTDSVEKVRLDRLLSLKTVCMRILRSVANPVVSMYLISSLHFSGLRTVTT